jgi:hypothetical protein
MYPFPRLGGHDGVPFLAEFWESVVLLKFKIWQDEPPHQPLLKGVIETVDKM